MLSLILDPWCSMLYLRNPILCLRHPIWYLGYDTLSPILRLLLTIYPILYLRYSVSEILSPILLFTSPWLTLFLRVAQLHARLRYMVLSFELARSLLQAGVKPFGSWSDAYLSSWNCLFFDLERFRRSCTYKNSMLICLRHLYDRRMYVRVPFFWLIFLFIFLFLFFLFQLVFCCDFCTRYVVGISCAHIYTYTQMNVRYIF